MVDIHTHILFDVDDGAQNVEDTIELLKEAEKVGFTKVICSSHYMEGYFTVDLDDRVSKLNEIKCKDDSNVEVYLGNEIFIIDNIPSLIKDKKAASLNNSKYVLFELPFNIKPLNLMDMIYQLQACNYVPILAHPERYAYFYKTPEIYENLVENGVLLQINYGSLIGQYGKTAKMIAEKLLKANLVYFIATDVHRPQTIYSEVPKIIEYLKELVGEEKANQLTTINPNLVIENKDIEIEKFTSIKYTFFEKMKISKR